MRDLTSLVFRALSLAVASLLTACHPYTMAMVDQHIRTSHYDLAAESLRRCAGESDSALRRTSPDAAACKQRLDNLRARNSSIATALVEESRERKAAEITESRKRAAAAADQEKRDRVRRLRASNDPWELYLLFSELTAGNIEPIAPNEAELVARRAFLAFRQCSLEGDPSCMGQYGELVLNSVPGLPESEKPEAKKQGLYWLTLAARNGYEPARRALIRVGEQVPTPDLAMERLQKEANQIAHNQLNAQMRAQREQAARDYQLAAEMRRDREAMIWASTFSKRTSCTSTGSGNMVFTNCW